MLMLAMTTKISPMTSKLDFFAGPVWRRDPVAVDVCVCVCYLTQAWLA
jgi:hypothetical protein